MLFTYLKSYPRDLSILTKINMAEDSGKQDVGFKQINVTVKTPRDKKDVQIDSNATIKQVAVSFRHCFVIDAPITVSDVRNRRRQNIDTSSINLSKRRLLVSRVVRPKYTFYRNVLNFHDF
jgi:hypothetical protein